MPSTPLPAALHFGSAIEPRRLVGIKGVIWVWRLNHHVYASEVRGHLDQNMARLIRSYAEPLYANGTVWGFHNWFEMTSYDSASRVELTNWVRSHLEQSHLDIGMSSKLVKLGVGVANLALENRIATSSTLGDLEAALNRVLCR